MITQELKTLILEETHDEMYLEELYDTVERLLPFELRNPNAITNILEELFLN